MQNRPRPRALLPLAALALIAPAVTLDARPAGTDLTIEVTGLRNEHGRVLACLTTNADNFPRCQNGNASYRQAVPAAEASRIRFHNVAPGTYAIALLHDENGNGKADRALMIPKEGFGFSRDAPVRMGPPSFKDAAIAVGDAPSRQTIHIRYML